MTPAIPFIFPTDLSLSEAAAASSLRELREHPAWQTLREILEKGTIRPLEEMIIRGGKNERAINEYRRACETAKALLLLPETYLATMAAKNAPSGTDVDPDFVPSLDPFGA